MILTNEQRIMYMEVLKLWLRKLNEKDEDFILGDLSKVQMTSQCENIVTGTTVTTVQLVYVKQQGLEEF